MGVERCYRAGNEGKEHGWAKGFFHGCFPMYPAKESWDLTASHQVTLWAHHSLEGGKQKPTKWKKTQNPTTKQIPSSTDSRDPPVIEQAGRMQNLEAVKQLAHYTGMA